MDSKENKTINVDGRENKDPTKCQSSFCISTETLAVKDKAMRNFKTGIVSEPIVLSDIE